MERRLWSTMKVPSPAWRRLRCEVFGEARLGTFDVLAIRRKLRVIEREPDRRYLGTSAANDLCIQQPYDAEGYE